MTKNTASPPKLGPCVQSLKSLSRNVKSPKQVADLYASALGLLCHLKVDQATLHATRQKGPQAPCPSPEKIPAMTTVIQDAQLYQALVRCLKSSRGSDGDLNDITAGSRLHVPPAHHHHHHHHHHPTNPAGSRKRAHSVTSETEALLSSSSKSMKISHSPTPQSRKIYRTAQDLLIAGNKTKDQPLLNAPMIAATILFVAFEHLDHWPAQLIEAYAEDCFGPRLWVDQEQCKLFVENLQLAHCKNQEENNSADGDAPMEDRVLMEDAARVAHAYINMTDVPYNEDDAAQSSPVPSPKRERRRGSLSSVNSTGMIPSTSSMSSLPRPRSGELSDSGGETEKAVKSPLLDNSLLKGALGGTKADHDGNSSSSGEEDEEVVAAVGGIATAKLLKTSSSDDKPTSPTSSHVDSEHCAGDATKSLLRLNDLYPVAQNKLNLIRVRQRFFGMNLQHAHNAIASCLLDRLDAKAKQNSALLQSLHSFTSIPVVRSLVAGNLERWLQSPGLSGLARTLFSSTVKEMKKVDPPLPADLEAIQKILAMRLKANQLAAHIENVTAIAMNLPSAIVANQVYHRLLSGILTTMSTGGDAASSDHLKMLGAVYSAFPKNFSADGIAASLLQLIGASMEHRPSEQSRMERGQLVKKLMHVIQLIAQQLGAAFDACKLLEALLSFDIQDESWTVSDEEDRARLMYQCVLLLVPSPKDANRLPPKGARKGPEISEAHADSLRTKLAKARKLLISWFCSDYGPHFSGVAKSSSVKHEEVGAGMPDYQSALGGIDGVRSYPKWLSLARCILFMETADSPPMLRFMGSHNEINGNIDYLSPDDRYRIERCCEKGCDLDDEMMWTILKSATLEEGGIQTVVALTLLEHLFESCSVQRQGSLKISDMMLVWELYTLVLYEPPRELVLKAERNLLVQKEDVDGDVAMNGGEPDELDLPQLAYPGFWWRVTIMALVMCGSAPNNIGATVWNEHPTLQALIKMVTSVRYRFPTVDCDENDRTDMKRSEQLMRDEEAKTAEALFFDPEPRTKKTNESDANYGGSRISLRQQQKRERALKKKREKEAVDALIEKNSRKKRLRNVQKTIMIWDPTGPARKPPRESADLLVAVESQFKLSRTFQKSTEPDFLLMTIGHASQRHAIERAFDWLIPIISDIPETISRLHASASCVLLLRAYGTEGDERAQIKELASPLLRHVTDSLTGRFGLPDAVRAFDLLMADAASHNPDRRRCARRVLYDSIGQLPSDDLSSNNSYWMLNIVRLTHAKSLVGDAIKHMSIAVTFERGMVLRNLLMALDKLIAFAGDNQVEGNWNFADVFIDLIARRPSVCAETMDRFADLRSLGIRTVYREFRRSLEDPPRECGNCNVAITLCRESGKKEATLSLPLLQSASVLLSIWTETNGVSGVVDDGMSGCVIDDEEAKAAVNDLASMLLHPIDAAIDGQKDDREAKGFASAKLAASGKSAVSVESWVMLAKSRSDDIARRAALTAPTWFLPRLLLCSGLPRASLLTMIDRLGILGDNAEAKDKVFHQLLVPSAASEWDIGRLGNRREVARKLLGRLSAYLRMNRVAVNKEEAKISTSFLEWLSMECKNTDKPKKHKLKQKPKAPVTGLPTLSDASSILATLTDPLTEECEEGLPEEEDDLDMEVFLENTTEPAELEPGGYQGVGTSTRIASTMEENRPDRLEKLLTQYAEKLLTTTSDRSMLVKHVGLDENAMALLLLKNYIKLQHQLSVSRVVTAWVPHLSRLSGSENVWQLLFSSVSDPLKNNTLDALLRRCIAAWCHDHVVSCYEWVVAQFKTTAPSTFDLRRTVDFLVLTSGQHSVEVDSFSSRICVRSVAAWGKSEDFVSSVASVAFESVNQAIAQGFPAGLTGRNNLPQWLTLLQILAKCGKSQMKFICEAVLERISKGGDEVSMSVLRAVFLRLYVSNPYGMNLGIALIRAVLMEAAEEFSSDWVDWRCPMDGQLQDMLEAVTSGSGQRLVRPLADISKKHPLLLLRRSHLMTQFLIEDAAVRVPGTCKEKRGIVHGERIMGPLEAVMSDALVKVKIVHWGFSYNEPIWIALLDVIYAVPGPVLFSCGLKMGFVEFLNVNIELVFVQSQLRRSEKEFRLKGKLRELLAAFRKFNSSGWERWMGSQLPDLPSLGDMKNVLVVCGLADAE